MSLSVRTKLFVIFFIIATISSITFGIFLYTAQKDLFYTTMEQRLKSATEAGGLFLGSDYIDKYTKDTPISEDEHLANVKALSEYAKSVGIKYIYMMIQDGSKVLTAISSATDEEIAKNEYDEFLAEYDASVGIKNGFRKNNTFLEETTDKYGHFYSYLTSKVSDKGTVYIIGSDIEVSYIDTELQSILFKTIAIVVCVMIVVGLLAMFITNQIGSRIELTQMSVMEFFRYLNRETESVKEVVINSTDEFGTMNKLINTNIEKISHSLKVDKQMVEDTLNISKMVKDGNLQVLIKSQPQNPQLIELKNVLNDMFATLHKSIDTIVSRLNEYIKNDYRNDIPLGMYKGEVEQLIGGINNLRSEIVHMLQVSLQNGLTLQNSSNVLKVNVEQLAKASNSVAASLEETSASIQEITANIRQNNTNVVDMTEYASSVTKSVNDGQQLASRTTVAMDDINTQVNAINDAITIIDQIAFQTNILSLNAAVEAATAGEAGKGFAVVAGEVRNLANRSALAAKDISNLVDQAKSKANDGKDIAGNMINGYNTLNENITKTLEIIRAVEVASKEQLIGIEQINHAILLIDKQIQSNANIANTTHQIAQSTDEIAHLVVQNVNSKDFNGKESIRGDVVNY